MQARLHPRCECTLRSTGEVGSIRFTSVSALYVDPSSTYAACLFYGEEVSDAYACAARHPGGCTVSSAAASGLPQHRPGLKDTSHVGALDAQR